MEEISMFNPTVQTVKACITTIAIPKSMDEFEGMVTKHLHSGRRMTDLESLLQWPSNQPVAWSGLKGMEAGDILLFYHGATSKDRARSLLKKAHQAQSPELITLLTQAVEHATLYGGKMFACGLVGGDAEWDSHPSKGAYHFKNRNFAPIDRVHFFEHPLHLSEFQQVVTINSYRSITTLKNQAFQDLKSLLRTNDNTLPNYLINAELAQ
jgi:hypothetical protein